MVGLQPLTGISTLDQARRPSAASSTMICDGLPPLSRQSKPTSSSETSRASSRGDADQPSAADWKRRRPADLRGSCGTRREWTDGHGESIWRLAARCENAQRTAECTRKVVTSVALLLCGSYEHHTHLRLDFSAVRECGRNGSFDGNVISRFSTSRRFKICFLAFHWLMTSSVKRPSL